MPYDRKQIAKELIDTALGLSYHGNALRVAKDIPCNLTPEEISVLDRWATGGNANSDHWELQRIAGKILGDDLRHA